MLCSASLTAIKKFAILWTAPSELFVLLPRRLVMDETNGRYLAIAVVIFIVGVFFFIVADAARKFAEQLANRVKAVETIK